MTPDISVIASLIPIAPELILFVTAIAVLLVEVVFSDQRPRMVTTTAILGLSLAFVATFPTYSEGTVELFSRSFVIDPVSQFFKTMLIFSGGICVLLAAISAEIRKNEKAEIHVLFLLGTLAMCVVCSATHFLLLFLAFEAAAIASFVLAAFNRKSALSSEAGTKLFVHSALTSILLAIGIVMLYGATKSFNILEIRTQLPNSPVSTSYLWVAFGLIFTAIAGRMAVFPFHFLAPDVFQGSPSPVSAFFSVSSNVTAIAFALRLCIQIFSAKSDLHWEHLRGFEWPQLIAGVAAVTMTFGNLAAIHQTNLKRLIGYSCIAQMGYILMGLAVSNHTGIAAVLFSSAAYGIVMLGAFFVVQMVIDHGQSEDISVLRGLVWKNAYEGVALCIFLLSLAGLPPLLGFIGKFYMLGVVIREKLYWLAIVGALNWVLGLTYYLSMIRNIFAPKPSGYQPPMVAGFAIHSALTILVGPTLLLGLYWDPLMNSITRFLGAVLW